MRALGVMPRQRCGRAADAVFDAPVSDADYQKLCHLMSEVAESEGVDAMLRAFLEALEALGIEDVGARIDDAIARRP